MAFVSLFSGCTCQYSPSSNTKLIIQFCKVHWGACIRNFLLSEEIIKKILINISNKSKHTGVYNVPDGWMPNCLTDLVCKYNSAGVQVFSGRVFGLHQERHRNLLSVEQIDLHFLLVWTGVVEAADLT